jgi:hypothetical protein
MPAICVVPPNGGIALLNLPDFVATRANLRFRTTVDFGVHKADMNGPFCCAAQRDDVLA